jgi:methyl-accepting chemotaxis protein
MKLTIGLLIFICISTITIHLAVTKKIDTKLVTILLGFGIMSAFIAANYDAVKYLRAGKFEVETATDQIEDAKVSALNEIASDVANHKEAIRLLMTTANDTSDKLEKQTETLSELIKTATGLQELTQKQKEELTSLNAEADKTKQSIQNLNLAASQIALSLIRTTYFTLETKNELGGGERLDKAKQEILKDLNAVLPMVIQDAQKRAQWVEDLQNTLPPRQP